MSLEDLVKTRRAAPKAENAPLAAQDGGPRVWIPDPSLIPWFEKPGAEAKAAEIAAAWDLGPTGRSWLEQWVRDGHFVVDDAVPHDLISAFAARTDNVWFRDQPLDGLSLSDVQVNGVNHVHIPHKNLLELPLEVRREAKACSNWRIGEYHLHDAVAMEVFRSERLRRICCAILDCADAQPHFSLTFSKGSRQLLHQDTGVFHVWPANALIGVWIAAEDIALDSGPLEYYPGSHREPMYHEFDNYPQTQRRTASPDQAQRYDRYVEEVALRYPRKTFTAKMGSALFWHGMLIHGGSPVSNENATRKSFVIHFMPEGANKGAEVEGPFNW